MKRQTLRLFKSTAVLILASSVLLPVNAWAALPAYMTATGETQGVIRGGVTQAGREDSMEIVEYGHSVSASLPDGGYIPTSLQHRAIRVTKPVDQATPILLTVLTNREKLTEVKIKFWRPSSIGKETQFYTVELLNAYIVNISQSQRTYEDDWRAVSVVPTIETLTITYEKIIWTWEDGGITAEDDWIKIPVQ